jgi:hypothetical protein
MPIGLRGDFDAACLRAVARKSKDGAQARRLAAIYDGAKRIEAAGIGRVTRQIVRDWVVRFNTEGPEGLRDRKAGPEAATDGRAPRCAGQDGRRRPNPCSSWRRALAARRSLPMGL